LRRRVLFWLVLGGSILFTIPAAAQDAPPPIGPFVFDVHGTFPKFTDNAQLASSRGLVSTELPGLGLGLHVGAHAYLLRWKAITFGLGGELMTTRANSSAKQFAGAEIARAVHERFTHVSPQLSFNFGTGDGWSYISGGFGPARWSIVPEGGPRTPADEERLTAINYGGGARWFAKRHLAFSFDVRLYAIPPGTPALERPGSPRTTLFVAGAGVSIK
jgi:hypothetical protein